MGRELIKLKDGYIENIYTDRDLGYEIDDYGCEYINIFTVYLYTKKIEISISHVYDYLLSEDYLMKLFTKNLDKIQNQKEEEFIDWLKNIIQNSADIEGCDFSFEIYKR